ncbi:hypothetical protein LCGC14_0534690 [marine sediment metagenome]|uniref:Uncharacterized protein n=1 Tax=marine sediment metagenome TaxID=412755 RepID=A0A0F9V2Q5_9ZZZZ
MVSSSILWLIGGFGIGIWVAYNSHEKWCAIAKLTGRKKDGKNK